MDATYISTRGGGYLGFEEAVMTGLARDGGLLVPAAIPDVRGSLPEWLRSFRFRGCYPDLALEVMRPFVDLDDMRLHRLLCESYKNFRDPDITPVRPVGGLWLLELFHGPTLAFKDVALQFLGNLFEHYLERSGGRLNLLGATSGDTGSAAIHGVRGRRNIAIAILFPRGRVSPLQERQMTTVPDANVFCAAVGGSFDDCQRLVKNLFRDLAFRDRYALGSINSINWARILAQVVYYFQAGIRVLDQTGSSQVSFAVPTGNFGDIFAGYLAWRMGLPIRRLILATNENDILARFFRDGVYARGETRPTLSPSMDIQVASNFERYLYYRVGADPDRTRAIMERFEQTGRISAADLPPPVEPDVFTAGSADTAATLATIREFHREHGCLLDPHTAVGVHVARSFREEGVPVICLATAHPAKFPQAIRDALGEDLARHESLDALRDLPVRCTDLPAETEAVRRFLAERFLPASAT
jgi:threonine synthase